MAKKEILNNDALTLRVTEDGAVDTVLDVAEKAIEATEQTLDILENQVERVVTITKNNPFVLAGVLLVGVGIGGFVAYKVTQKRLGAQFDEELRTQIEAAKEYHRKVNKDGEFSTPESAVKVLVPDEVVEAVQSYQGRERPVAYDKPETIDPYPRPPVDVVVEEVQVTQNVFVEASKNKDPRDWDLNAEIEDRALNPDIPFAIGFEEFNENEAGHEQTTLTYYSEDDTLVDAQDKPIDSVDYTIGDDNLNRFGDGSGDPNVVYVRNPKIEMDFEVIRENGSYQKAVFGTDPDPSLRHSRRRPDRRSWRADE